MSTAREVSLDLNGQIVEVTVATDEALLEALTQLGLRSVRGACGIGICGSCTVLADGRPISSCLTLTALIQDSSLVTSEGLGDDGHLDPVQEAFIRNNAFQCSFCIPGMVLAVRSYLDGTDGPTLDGALDALAGNLCRCGSYPQVREALEAPLAEENL
ncbi:MAG: 2Fe-2S iron-sulfur cluster binding domain-containing protein [Actinobacteria bacterium]|nr:2Fe-2S iron-sulfur cluster binding domain-containing protein [Actinomycetota bacterium]